MSPDEPVERRASGHRRRGWPPAGQIGLAIVVGVVIAIFVGVVSHHDPSTRTTGTTGTTPRRATVTTRTTVTTVSTVTTRRTGTTGPGPVTGLVPLTIAPRSHQGTYDRTADFGGWTDVEGCEDTRATLLIRTSRAPVTFTSARDCTVATGRWIDPWSGVTTNDARAFQIDHTVPLGNAWASGAWSWTHEQRVEYTNDLAETDHLVPILAHENEQKSDDGPDQWRPPSHDAWCRYALDWDHIKADWHLSATTGEWAALREMTATC